MAKPIIAMLTDFGTRDHYAGTLKAVVLNVCPDATLVDIGHDIPAHDVMAGALELAACYRYFPHGTIFLVVVDPGVGSARRGIAADMVGMSLNFANIIALPLMFGVGVAFHIYYVIAWRKGVADMLASSLTRAIFFSALTTGTAFGSLFLSSHPGTASMGELLTISLFFTLLAAFIIVPAFLGPPRVPAENAPDSA